MAGDTTNPGAPITRVGYDGWNTESPFWTDISTPTNVLEIPSKLPPRGPVVAQSAPGTAIQYLAGECCADPTALSVILVHEAHTGWWFPVYFEYGFCIPCNLDSTYGDDAVTGCTHYTQPFGDEGPPISGRAYAELVFSYQDALYSESNIPFLLNPKFAIQCTLPDWVQQDTGEENCVFDYYAVACVDQSQLIQIQIGDTKPPPQCPEGMQWDPIALKCVTIPVITPIPQNDPEGDEITDTLCAQLDHYTQEIIKAIGDLKTSAPDDSACCAALTLAIANVSRTLGFILNKLPPTNSLANISDGLKGIATALRGLATTPTPIDLTPVTDAIDRVVSAIASSPGTDVSQIVAKLNTIAEQGDTDQFIVDYMRDYGYITANDAQILQGIKWADIVPVIVSALPFYYLIAMLKPLGLEIEPVTRALLAAGKPADDWAIEQLNSVLTSERNLLAPSIKSLLDKVLTALEPSQPPAVGDVHVDADLVLADVTAVAINTRALQAFVGLVREGASEQMEHATETVLGILGFEELREVQLGPLVRHGIAAAAEQRAKAKYQQELPGWGTIFSWVARGLLEPPRADELAALNGLHTSLRGPALQSAYHGMQARQLIRLSGTGLFSDGDLTDELTFSGMRPSSQKRLLTAAPWLATNSQRGKLKATLEKLYVEGMLSDADLDQELAQLNHNIDGDAMSLRAAQIEKQIVFAKRLEIAYSKQFISGFILDTQYRALLEGIGLQPDWINNKVAVDQASDQAIEYRKQLAAELAAERATVAEERRAATKNYLAGNTNAPGLAASLLLTGLNANQAAAWVDLATATRAGNLRWVYGLQLSPGEASLLRERVGALTDQRKRQLIADPAYEGALKALGIPEHWVNSLRATASAMLTPAKDAIHLPVELPQP